MKTPIFSIKEAELAEIKWRLCNMQTSVISIGSISGETISHNISIEATVLRNTIMIWRLLKKIEERNENNK